jgi:hypothetical protein
MSSDPDLHKKRRAAIARGSVVELAGLAPASEKVPKTASTSVSALKPAAGVLRDAQFER